MELEIDFFEGDKHPDFNKVIDLRNRIFVKEQGKLASKEHDKQDEISLHLIATLNNNCIATCRIIKIDDSNIRIGRVCVDEAYRGHGFGSVIMQKCHEKCLELYPDYDWFLHAQCYAVDFYSKFGYEIVGQEFVANNIPHVKMIRYASKLKI